MIQSYNPSTFPRRPARVSKTIERWILYLVVLGIAGVALYWFINGRGKTFEVSLDSKKGTIEYRENEKDSWKTINSVPLKINVSSEIRTLADSEASFSLGDGSKIELGSFSRIVLASNQGEVNWVQTDGVSHHQTVKNNDRKSYKVSISDGVVESQGTAFEVKIKETDTAILVLKDEVKITYKDKSTASAKAGEEILINPVGKKVKEIDSQELQEDWTLNNLKEDQKNSLPIDENVLAKAGLPVKSASSAVDNQENTDNSEQTDAGENNENTNANTTITTEQSSSVEKPAANVNNNSSVVTDNNNSSSANDQSTSSTSASSTADSSNTATSGSSKTGVTSRKNCENSGGHWTKATSACKCPANEVFVSSVGRCKKK